MKILRERNVRHVHLHIHGANLEFQTEEFQNTFREAVACCRDSVTLVGRYANEDIPGLMSKVDWVVVPSVWWENSPLVIQEAKMHRRPVICSGVGGMAEKVDDRVSGLHFRVNDPHDLAEAMLAAADDPEMWSRLRERMPRVTSIEECVSEHVRLYDSLMRGVPQIEERAIHV